MTVLEEEAFESVVNAAAVAMEERDAAIKERDQARACARVHRRALQGDVASLALCQALHALPDWLVEGIG